MLRAYLARSGFFGGLGGLSGFGGLSAIRERLAGASRDLEFARAVIAQYEIDNSRLREQLAMYKEGFVLMADKHERYHADSSGRNVYFVRDAELSDEHGPALCGMYPREVGDENRHECIGCGECSELRVESCGGDGMAIEARGFKVKSELSRMSEMVDQLSAALSKLAREIEADEEARRIAREEAARNARSAEAELRKALDQVSGKKNEAAAGWIDAKEVAAMVRCSQNHVWRKVRNEPDFPRSYKLGPHKARWKKSEIEAYIESCQATPRPPERGRGRAA